MRPQMLLILLLLFVSSVSAANDPGHDSLYVLLTGDSAIDGSLNITNLLNATNIRAANLLYGDQLDIRGNGSVYTIASRPAIQADSSDLYLDSNGNIYIGTQGGTSGFVQVGPTSGSSITLNVSGVIRQQNVAVCLSNGTNCPAGAGAEGNITSVGAGDGLSNSGTDTDPVLDVYVGDGLSIAADQVIVNNATVCRSDGTGCQAATVDTNASNCGTGQILDGDNECVDIDGLHDSEYVEVADSHANSGGEATVSGAYNALVVTLSDSALDDQYLVLEGGTLSGRLDIQGVLNATGIINGSAVQVAGVDVCLSDGTNCPASSGGSDFQQWNISADSGGVAAVTNGTLVNITGGQSITTTLSGTDVSVAVTANSIDGAQLANSLTLDASTNIIGTASTDFSVNTSNLFVDFSNNNVGIGTTTPNTSLEVMGTVKITPDDLAGLKAKGSVSITTSNAYNMALKGNVLFASRGATGDVYVLDVLNPDNPKIITTITEVTAPSSLTIAGNYLYVNDVTADKLMIFDVSDLSNIVNVGNASLNAVNDIGYGIKVSGKYAFVGYADNGNRYHFDIFDVSNPASPQILSNSQGGSRSDLYGFEVYDDFAYLVTDEDTDYGDITLIVYDLHDKENPSKNTAFQFWNDAAFGAEQSVRIVGVAPPYLYVIKSSGPYFHVFNITDPTSANKLGNVSLSGSQAIRGVISGRYAYVLDGTTDNIDVIDLADPLNPVIVATYKVGSSTNDILVDGKYLYDKLGTALHIYELPGISASNGIIDSLEAGVLTVRQNVFIGGTTNIEEGVTVGTHGVWSRGPLSTQNDSYVGGSLGVGLGMTAPGVRLHVNGSINVTTGNDICITGGNCLSSAGGSSGGNVSGNGTSTDNAIARFAGTNGTVIQNSGVIIDDSDAVTGVTTLNTGQGAYELYAMDQDVETSDSPSFAGLTISGTGDITMPDAFFIGASATSNGTYSIAIGTSASAISASSIAIGRVAESFGSRSVAIGELVDAKGLQSIGIGYNAIANGSESVAIGVESDAWVSESVAVGGSAWARNEASVAIGNSAQATGISATALGAYAQASGSSSLAVGGSSTQASATYATALGQGAAATDTYAAAIGPLTVADEANSVALGRGANTGAENQLMIGSSSYNLNTQIIGTLNTSGAITQNSVAVCLSDGTNCPAGASDQNLWETITSDSGSVAANIATDTLTISGGGSLDSSVSGDTLTIDVTDNTIDGTELADTITLDAVLAINGQDVNFDSNTLMVDVSEDRVGVGTASPTAQFEVSGRANFTNANVSIENTFSLCFNDACTSRIYDNGTALIIEGQ